MDLAAVGMEAHPSLEHWKPGLIVGSLWGFAVGSAVGVSAGQQRCEPLSNYGPCDSLFGQGNGAILHRWAAEMLRLLASWQTSCRGLVVSVKQFGFTSVPTDSLTKFKVSSEWQTESHQLHATMRTPSHFPKAHIPVRCQISAEGCEEAFSLLPR